MYYGHLKAIFKQWLSFNFKSILREASEKSHEESIQARATAHKVAELDMTEAT